jgi:hypothetical protein
MTINYNFKTLKILNQVERICEGFLFNLINLGDA